LFLPQFCLVMFGFCQSPLTLGTFYKLASITKTH
jgi:hypothetical protein